MIRSRYLDPHVSTTPHSKVPMALLQQLNALAELLRRRRAKHAGRGQDLRVGPEVLRLLVVDRVGGEEDRVGEAALQGVAAGGVCGVCGCAAGERETQAQRESVDEAHGGCDGARIDPSVTLKSGGGRPGRNKLTTWQQQQQQQLATRTRTAAVRPVLPKQNHGARPQSRSVDAVVDRNQNVFVILQAS